MGFPLNEFFLGLGRVMATTVHATKKAVLQNFELLTGEGSNNEAQYGPIGRYARPMPPVSKEQATGLNPEGEAELVGLRRGDEVFGVGYRDLRLNAQVNPADGAIGDAHYGGGFIEQSWNATKDGTTITLNALRKLTSGAADKASALFLDSTKNAAHVTLLHESGSSVVLDKDGGIVATGKEGKAWVHLKQDGSVVISGTSVAVTGGVMLGDKNPALGDPVMLSTQLLAWIGQVNAAFTAIAAAAGANPNPAITAPVAVPVAATVTKAK